MHARISRSWGPKFKLIRIFLAGCPEPPPPSPAPFKFIKFTLILRTFIYKNNKFNVIEKILVPPGKNK